MLVPPYLQQYGRPETVTLANEVLRTSKEVRVILGQFYLYIGLARDARLRRAVSDAKAADGVAIVEGTLLRTLVLGVAAVFDQNPQTSNLPKLVRTSLGPTVAADLAAFHRHYGATDDAERAKEELVRIQRKLRSGAMAEAISRLVVVRKTYIAHYDANPDPVPRENRALIRDIDRAVAVAGILTSHANLWVLGRQVDTSAARVLMRQQAAALTQLIYRGAKASTE